jgi:hypothetical protein
VPEKCVGAVDGVDHPHEALLEPVGVVLGLFRQPAIIRPATEQRAFERSVDCEIRLAHLGAVELRLHREVLAEIAMGELASRLHRILQQAKVLVE